MSRYVLLLERESGETVGVVCNSREAADRIREATQSESVGMVRVIPFAEAITDR